MSLDKARNHLKSYNMDSRIIILEDSTATVELAAKALNTKPERIAKTLSFLVDDNPILIVMAGDVKIDNHKYKAFFGKKAKMLTPDEVDSLIGHSIGGVCPFGVNDEVAIYLDNSLKRFETVFPACGSANSAIELTPDELEGITHNNGWIDVTKPIEEEIPAN